MSAVARLPVRCSGAGVSGVIDPDNADSDYNIVQNLDNMFQRIEVFQLKT